MKTQRFHVAPRLPAGTIVVQHAGEIVASGPVSDPVCLAAIRKTADADIFLAPDVAQAFREFQAAQAAMKRRLH